MADSVQTDVVNLLAQLIPPGVWLHDAQDGDGDGDAHLKASIVGKLGLSTWQNLFLCEFDGPRHERRFYVL